MSVDIFDVRLLEPEDAGVVAAGSVFGHVEVAHTPVHIPSFAGGRIDSEEYIVVVAGVQDTGVVPLCRRSIPDERFMLREVGARQGNVDEIRNGHGAYLYSVFTQLLTLYF